VSVTSDLYALDATADVDGDGVADLLVADPVLGGRALGAGGVMLASGANGANLASISGDSVKSNYGSSSTVVGDRDGDGWRDLAVAVRGGLAGTNPGLVQIVSGQDGHELSRFQTLDHMLEFELDRQIVATPDVNGDGIADLAVSAPGDYSTYPYSNVVE